MRWKKKDIIPRIYRISAKRNERIKELLHIESMFAPYRKIVLVKDLSRNMLKKEGVTIEKNC